MRISDWSSDVCSSDLTSSRPSRSTRAAATTTSDVFGSFPGVSADKLLTFLCEWGHPRELYFSQGWNNAKLLQADAVDQGRHSRRIWADPGPYLSGGRRRGRRCRQFDEQYVERGFDRRRHEYVAATAVPFRGGNGTHPARDIKIFKTYSP